jgi:hypothetical protein
MLLELTSHGCSFHSHWNQCPESRNKGNYRNWSLSVPTIFVITQNRDVGTIPDRVSGVQVRIRGNPPIVQNVLTFQDHPRVPKGWALATQHRLKLNRKITIYKCSKLYLGFMESIPILKINRHPWSYSRFPLPCSYKERRSVSTAIGVFIHSLILSFIHSIHFSWSPHLKCSSMKQGKKKQSPSAQAHANGRPTNSGVRPGSARDVQWY